MVIVCIIFTVHYRVEVRTWFNLPISELKIGELVAIIYLTTWFIVVLTKND